MKVIKFNNDYDPKKVEEFMQRRAKDFETAQPSYIVCIFKDKDGNWCQAYSSPELHLKIAAKSELEIDIIDQVIRANKERYHP